MMKYRNIQLLIVAAGSCLILGGCAAALIAGGAAAGVGTVAYVKGELSATKDASLDRVWNASLLAMEDMQFIIVQKEKDAVEGLIKAEGASDKKIRIAMKSSTPKITEITIRVDTFGDEDLSRMILQKIDARL